MGRTRLLVGISIFWLALSMLSDGLNTLVLPDQLLRISGEHHKATILGLLTFVGLVAGMLVQPMAGAMSDRLYHRWGRRGMLALGTLLIIASLAFFGFAPGLLAVVIAYLLVQASIGVAQAAQQGFIPDLVPAEQRGIAAGFKGFMDLGGAMLGFVVLGQLLGRGGIRPGLLAITVVLVVALCLTVGLVREPTRARVPTEDRFSPFDAFRIDLHQHRAFVWLVVSRFLFLLGTYAIGRFFLYFVADRLNLDPDRAAEQAGVLLGGLALITALGALPAGWAADRFGRTPMMCSGALLSAVGALALIVASSSMSILVGGALMAIGSAAFASANWAYTADLAPADQAARFMALANVGTAGAAAAAGLFGPLMGGVEVIAGGAGYPTLFVASAMAFVASALALLGVSSSSRELAAATVPAQRAT